MTIGAVCKALEQEFPDISISKIRYLEDQKLLAPRRTPGGYRLYSRRRRAAPAHDPAPAARRVPAAAGHPPGAGLRARAATTSRRRPRRARARARPRRRTRSAAVSVRDAARCTRSRTSSRRRAPSRGWSPSSRTTASSRARSAPGASTTTRPSARSSARSPSWPATASAGATCAPSARRPTARRRCCSRSSPRRCARATPSGARRRIEALENLAAVTTHLKHLLLDPRPAQDRRLEQPGHGRRPRRARPRHPGLPEAGDRLQGHHAAAGRRPRRSTRRSAGWPTLARDLRVEVVIGAEARGFLLGPALARELGAGFVLARKPGKLPHDTVRAEYALEYGTDALELHSDAVRRVRACSSTTTCWPPGGTARGAVRAGRAARRRGRRAACFLIELAFLGGRERLAGTTSARCCATTPSRCRTDAPQPRPWPRRRARVGDGRRPAPPAALVAARRRASRPSRRALHRGAAPAGRARGARRLPRGRVARARAPRCGSRSSRARRSSACSPRRRPRSSSSRRRAARA